MARWKYQNKKEYVQRESPYVYLPDDKAVELTVKDWTFEKNAYNDSLFSCHVIMMDGQTVDKIWSVWDFNLKEDIKKILKSKKVNKDSVKVKVLKKRIDEVENEFEISEIKD